MLTILIECTAGIVVVAGVLQVGVWLYKRFRQEWEATKARWAEESSTKTK